MRPSRWYLKWVPPPPSISLCIARRSTARRSVPDRNFLLVCARHTRTDLDLLTFHQMRRWTVMAFASSVDCWGVFEASMVVSSFLVFCFDGLSWFSKSPLLVSFTMDIV